MIRYDHTPTATTVYCECGWVELTITREGAWSVAADHERRVHPHRHQVRGAAQMRELRRNGRRDVGPDEDD